MISGGCVIVAEEVGRTTESVPFHVIVADEVGRTPESVSSLPSPDEDAFIKSIASPKVNEAWFRRFKRTLLVGRRLRVFVDDASDGDGSFSSPKLNDGVSDGFGSENLKLAIVQFRTRRRGCPTKINRKLKMKNSLFLAFFTNKTI